MVKARQPEPLSDLISRARTGDDAAVEELCRRLVPALHGWASGRLPPHARDMRETSDLVQEVLVKSLGRLKEFEPRHEGALVTYLHRGIMNRIRDEVRRVSRRGAREEVQDDLPDSRPGPLQDAIDHQNTEQFEAALRTLDPPDREAIVARLEMGLSYEQAAVLLGRPTPAAARQAIRRAILKLADAIAAK